MSDASTLVAALGQSDRLADALACACRLHGRQKRKGTEIPYVAHLLAVCALVIEDGGDDDQAVAALLHDAVEDAGGRPVLTKIRRRFGPCVATIVDACTDADQTPKPPWEERKRAYVEELRTAPPEALLVSLADKVHNARSILADYREVGEELWIRFTGTREQQLWYYDALSDVFHERCRGALVDELEHTVDALRREIELQRPPR